METRLAVPTDQAAIEACVAEAYRPYVDRMGKQPAPMLDDYAELIERGAVHVAASSNGLLGVIVMWPKDDHLYVDNIAVADQARGTGVGSQLLDHAASVAAADGKSEIRLYTNEAMVENLDYYPARGFVETHRAADAGYNRVYFSRPVD